MPEEETKQPPTEEKTATAPPAEPPAAPPEVEEPDDEPQIDDALRKRLLDVQERFLRRDVTLGTMADAGVLSEFMFNICDTASTAKAIKEVCGVMNIETEDFFATFGFDPDADEEDEDGEDEEDIEEDGDEPDEEPEPPAPANPKKARKDSKMFESDLVR